MPLPHQRVVEKRQADIHQVVNVGVVVVEFLVGVPDTGLGEALKEDARDETFTLPPHLFLPHLRSEREFV
jgi:hypothetical protein